jgi:hypothetical protein
MDVCYNVEHKGVFIVSQGRFLDLATTFPWKSMAEQQPRGRSAIN